MFELFTLSQVNYVGLTKRFSTRMLLKRLERSPWMSTPWASTWCRSAATRCTDQRVSELSMYAGAQGSELSQFSQAEDKRGDWGENTFWFWVNLLCPRICHHLAQLSSDKSISDSPAAVAREADTCQLSVSFISHCSGWILETTLVVFTLFTGTASGAIMGRLRLPNGRDLGPKLPAPIFPTF